MKVLKIIGLTGFLSLIGVLTFNITYATVSASEMKKQAEKAKTDIVYRVILDKDEDKDVKLATKDSSVQKNHKKPIINKSDNFIFVGDCNSLNYEMIPPNFNGITKVITQNSNNKNWLDDFVIERLNNLLESADSTYNVVFNLGINDLNKEEYSKIFNKLAQKNFNHNFFVTSINPVDELKLEEIEESYKNEDLDIFDEDFKIFRNVRTDLRNAEITRFNRLIRDSLNENVHYIDTHKELIINGFDTQNGIIYSDETCAKLFDTILNIVDSL